MINKKHKQTKDEDMPKTRILINFEPEEKERIQEIANRESRSFSNFIVNAVREYIRDKYNIDLTQSKIKKSK
jgi:uncharacterized protein (DUF1778 family)